MTLDERIYQDLGDLLGHGQIQNAINVEKAFGVSSHAIPGYFAGKRNAKTVFVNLNPGCDATMALYNSMPKLVAYRYLGFNAFVQNHKSEARNAGFLLGGMLDHFDLKTAYFLSQWPNCGINFPNDFPINGNNETTNNKSIQIQANINCLNQKLQLEMLPYPSKNFDRIKIKNVEYLYPFIETIFQEIFRTKREYVIFAATQFEFIFKNINSKINNYRIVNIPFIKCSTNLNKKPDTINNQIQLTKPVFCTPIVLEEISSRKQQNAIIANTFSNQSFSRAYDLMRQYGGFCYDTFKNYHSIHSTNNKKSTIQLNP